MKKGISLSINAIIILAISVLVLVTIVALFMSSVRSSGNNIATATKINLQFNSACNKACKSDSVEEALSTTLSSVTKNDARVPGGGNDLATIRDVCQYYYQLDMSDNGKTCLERCGCGYLAESSE